MRREAETPEAYREQLEGEQRALVDAIRAVILEVAPEIEEGLAHGMLDYSGLANLAAQKRYVSLYVAPTVLAEYRKRFEGVAAGKSCLRFTRLEQADPELLRGLLVAVREFRRK